MVKFQFEVLAGTDGHRRILRRLLDLMEKGFVVEYEETPNDEIPSRNWWGKDLPKQTIKGTIARGRVIDEKRS